MAFTSNHCIYCYIHHLAIALIEKIMRVEHFTLAVLLVIVIGSGCANKLYTTNGESIYMSGMDLTGRPLLDKEYSEITLFKSCNGCHGPSGTRIKSCNVQWSYLTDSSKLDVPYTEELFIRFLDEDLKSDGSKARTGVHWQMTVQDKSDLIEYLKTL